MASKRAKERKSIVNDYRQKPRKKSTNPNSYEARYAAKMRPPMQSEMINVNNMNGTDDLVSSLSGLSIAKKEKKNRGGRKSQICGIQSQQIVQQEPSRKNPCRNAKTWKEGELKAAKLSQRVYHDKEFDENQERVRKLKESKLGKAPTQDDTMQIDDQTGPSMDASNPVYDPADPFALIRLDQNNVDEDIECDACLDNEYDEGDEIVICEACLVGVHRSCYGSELRYGIPSGDWYCQRCAYIKQNP